MSDEDQRPFTIMMAFRQTARLMIDELIERLEADGHVGVHPSHHALYENIDPQGTRLTELAARAAMTHQSMGELVASLERGGWVERRPDPTDGRARLVCLTRAGRPRHPRPAPHRRDRGRMAGALARGRPRRHPAPRARARREGRRANARSGLDHQRGDLRARLFLREPAVVAAEAHVEAMALAPPDRLARRRQHADVGQPRAQALADGAQPAGGDDVGHAVDRRALAQQALEAVDHLVDRLGPAVQEEVARGARRDERATPAARASRLTISGHASLT